MSKKILVVEDELLILKTIEGRLQKKGYEVAIAVNGEVGLEKIQTESPDLLIIDSDMPQMNGYSFLIKWREQAAFKSIPVIVLLEQEDMKPIFIRKGIKDFLAKPINWDLLYQIVDQVLA